MSDTKKRITIAPRKGGTVTTSKKHAGDNKPVDIKSAAKPASEGVKNAD